MSAQTPGSARPGDLRFPPGRAGRIDFHGLQLRLGALLASPNGTWTLYAGHDLSDYHPVLESTAAPRLAHDGVVLSVTSPGASLSTTMPAQPCLSNGMFGPPFAWDPDGQFFALAVSEHLFDPSDPLAKHVPY